MRYLKASVYVCVSFVLLGSPAFAQEPLDIKWSNERLTVRVSNAPLADIMAEVTRLTGIEVIGRDKLAGRITVDFSNEGPREALAALLSNVNYVVQERARPGGGSARELVVSVHSMAGYTLPADVFSGPIHVPSLEAFVAEAAEEAADDKETDADDPDTLEEMREELAAVTRLTAEGAFGPEADVNSIAKHAQNLYNDEIRLTAIKTLGTRPMKSVLAYLLKTLGDEIWDVRNAGVEILGRATDHESLQAVGQLLVKSDDVETRIDALRILATRGDSASTAHLRSVLKDKDRVVRDAAEYILGELDRRARAKREHDAAGRVR